MMSKTSRLISRIINKWGEDVNIKRRTETIDDDGDVTFTYPTTITVKAQVNALTGYKEPWDSTGVEIQADYLVSFKIDTKVDVGDLVEIAEEDHEVVNKINRKSSDKVDYIETLCKRRRNV